MEGVLFFVTHGCLVHHIATNNAMRRSDVWYSNLLNTKYQYKRIKAGLGLLYIHTLRTTRSPLQLNRAYTFSMQLEGNHASHNSPQPPRKKKEKEDVDVDVVHF